jgi:hypothetical protein
MKLHSVTWILLWAAGLQLAAAFIGLAMGVRVTGEAQDTVAQYGFPSVIVWQAFAQSFGGALTELAAVAMTLATAAWVEALARIHAQLKAVSAARGTV